MPAKSKSQFRMLQALIHGQLRNKPNGFSKKEAKEMLEKTKSYKKLPEKVNKK